MTLIERLTAFAQAVGTDIKTLKARRQIIFSDNEPVLTEPGYAMWVKTSDDPPTLWELKATQT